MAQQKRKMSRNEKIFYVISLLVILSMVVGSVAVAFTGGF
jgi:cell division protein FtsL